LTKPKHRLQITFTASEIPNRPITQTSEAWKILDPGEEQVFTFNSDVALCQPQDHYFEGHSSEQAEGHCWYSWMQPAPLFNQGMSLRVLWWEITYADGSEWVAGAVLNESMEGPLGRLRGKLEITALDGARVGILNATLSDQNGCCFSFGQPQAWVHPEKLRWYVNRFRNDGTLPPDFFWVPQPCPDAQGGDAWQPQWTPFQVDMKNPDGSYVLPKYWNSSDPRNPPIGKFIGKSRVADWYLRQTHSHYREGGDGFRTPQETAWQAAGRAGDKPLETQILSALWDYTQAQVGGLSPTGQGYIDGRPNHLALLSGDLFRAGQKYNLNAQDQAAPFTAVLHEGRPQIGKSGQQFWENFGRSGIHWVEVTASQFKGLYGLPNGSDFEHCASGPLAAASVLYGDPLAARQLHHICEEHVSQGTPLHSTRSTSGWFLVDLADGHVAFQGNPVFGADADRYREHAFKVATEVWQRRLDQTPYQGVLSVEYGRLITEDASGDPLPESAWMGNEATMQLSIALHAGCVWYQLESNETRRAFWRAWIDYIAKDCIGQPGVIDWSRGGILKRYSIQGPAALDPNDPKSIGERLEMTAPPNYNSREVLSAEGWVGPAMAEAWLVTQDQRTHDIAKEIYDHQALVNVGHNVKQFSPQNWSAWGQFWPSIQAFGWSP